MAGSWLGKHARGGWRAGRTLVVIVSIGCSPALENRQPTARDAAPPEAPTEGQLELPTPDLLAKHEAARSAPSDFDAVIAYAQAVADFCVASLAAPACAADCPEGPGAAKPTGDLSPKHWVLAQDGLNMLAPFKDAQGLPVARFEQLVAVKSRLLGMVGHADEERALIDGYARAHPETIAVVKRRLELLRAAGVVRESESQCRRSRTSTKSAPEATRLEILAHCVALHPANASGQSDPPDYAQYLPEPSRAEQRLYRKHMIGRCVEKLGTREARCGPSCACDDQPDRQQKADCKRRCRDCRIESARKTRECRKTGGVPGATRVGRPPRTDRAVSPGTRPSPPRSKAGESPPETGPEPQATVL